MKNNNYSTVIDFGTDTLRLSVFNNDLKNIFSSSKEISVKKDFEEHSKSLNFLIREAEKKISSHLENIVVLYDNSEFYSIDLSIKKDFDHPVQIKEIYYSLMKEANLLIANNYLENKIIHLITTKSIFDGIDTYENFKNDKKAKSIIIEIKFLCLNWKRYNDISNIFKKNNLEILNLYCSSYVKSFFYLNQFKEKKFLTFLDIGWERSTIVSYKDNRVVNFNSIPIGGNHITKDISKVLKLNLDYAEKIKKTFNKSEIEFSFDENDDKEKKFLIQEIIGKNISIDLIKKVILSRVEEVISLACKDIYFSDETNDSQNSNLILTGKGSKIFNKNSFHLDIKYNFTDISFYEESDSEICSAGNNFNRGDNNELHLIKKNKKKKGFFENFFNLFSR